MKLPRWTARPSLLALLTIVVALVPLGFALQARVGGSSAASSASLRPSMNAARLSHQLRDDVTLNITDQRGAIRDLIGNLRRVGIHE